MQLQGKPAKEWDQNGDAPLSPPNAPRPQHSSSPPRASRSKQRTHVPSTKKTQHVEVRNGSAPKKVPKATGHKENGHQDPARKSVHIKHKNQATETNFARKILQSENKPVEIPKKTAIVKHAKEAPKMKPANLRESRKGKMDEFVQTNLDKKIADSGQHAQVGLNGWDPFVSICAYSGSNNGYRYGNFIS